MQARKHISLPAAATAAAGSGVVGVTGPAQIHDRNDETAALSYGTTARAELRGPREGR